jgi:hypothetical protein
MTNVFISYSRKDTGFATRLVNELKENDIEDWFYQRDIPAGKRWDNKIEQAIKNCTHLLVILSPDSVASENVKDEIGFALGEKKTIIPVMHRDCEVPMRIDRIQRIDFRKDFTSAFENL